MPVVASVRWIHRRGKRYRPWIEVASLVAAPRAARGHGHRANRKQRGKRAFGFALYGSSTANSKRVSVLSPRSVFSVSILALVPFIFDFLARGLHSLAAEGRTASRLLWNRQTLIQPSRFWRQRAHACSGQGWRMVCAGHVLTASIL
jgi:hypothetical protein